MYRTRLLNPLLFAAASIFLIAFLLKEIHAGFSLTDGYVVLSNSKSHLTRWATDSECLLVFKFNTFPKIGFRGTMASALFKKASTSLRAKATKPAASPLHRLSASDSSQEALLGFPSRSVLLNQQLH